jgi:hypothetical protein
MASETSLLTGPFPTVAVIICQQRSHQTSCCYLRLQLLLIFTIIPPPLSTVFDRRPVPETAIQFPDSRLTQLPPLPLLCKRPQRPWWRATPQIEEDLGVECFDEPCFQMAKGAAWNEPFRNRNTSANQTGRS